MTFDKRLKLRQIASVICFLAGIGMIFLSFRLEEQEGFLYLHSYYCGGGGGIIGASAVNFFRAHSLLHNPEKRREAEIRELDERNVYIQRASYSIFVTLSLLLTCVGSFVAALFNPVVCFVLADSASAGYACCQQKILKYWVFQVVLSFDFP